MNADITDTYKRGKPNRKPFTPTEILFEIQLQARGWIEIDIPIRTVDPFRYERAFIGEPISIRGLEPGEIMKFRRDLQAWILHWRAMLALEREDAELVNRVKVSE